MQEHLLVMRGGVPRFKGWKLLMDQLPGHWWGNATVSDGYLFVIGSYTLHAERNEKKALIIDLRTLEYNHFDIPFVVGARPAVSSYGDKFFVHGSYIESPTTYISGDYGMFEMEGLEVKNIRYKSVGVGDPNRKNCHEMVSINAPNGIKSIVTLGTGDGYNRILFIDDNSNPIIRHINTPRFVRNHSNFVYNDKVYIVGGSADLPLPQMALTDVYEFTPNASFSNGTLVKFTDLPFGRVRAGSYVKDNNVYLLGGGTRLSNTIHADTFCTPDNYIQKLNMDTKEFTNIPLEDLPPQDSKTRQFIWDDKLWQWSFNELWCRWIDDII